MGRRSVDRLRKPTETAVESDTVWVRDTVTVRDVRTAYVDRRTVDTMLVTVHDTVTVQLPRESVHYRDSLFEAWVSGYRPRLDSVSVYPQTRCVTVTVRETAKDRRWGIGVQAGFGASMDGLTPYVGVGVSYSLARF